MRRAAKKDGNHNEIADYLRAHGWSVLDLSRLGGGCPDMAVGRSGFACLIECKQPGESLTPDQVAVRKKWDAPYIVAYDKEQALADLYMAMRNET
jgi:Holliday junction resolvase